MASSQSTVTTTGPFTVNVNNPKDLSLEDLQANVERNRGELVVYSLDRSQNVTFARAIFPDESSADAFLAVTPGKDTRSCSDVVGNPSENATCLKVCSIKGGGVKWLTLHLKGTAHKNDEGTYECKIF